MNMNDRRNLIICGLTFTAAMTAAAAVGLIHLPAGSFDPGNPQTTLTEIEDTVSTRSPVPEITDKMLRPALSDPNTLTFDVREPEEYKQSHLAGAHRVDPGMSAADFFARYGNEIKGKLVVFYCAAGVRSGEFLTRIQPAIAGRGVKAAANLRGGIFRWYANGGQVVNDNGPASSVHPFDPEWAKLLERTLKTTPGAPKP